MNIKFNSVKIHNFLSIGDAEIDLANKGFVLVRGVNNSTSDNALSNGSGKSTIFNAICWCLTGETIQGLKTNIPNIHGEDGCFVVLNFVKDGSHFEVTRYREYAKIKNNLKFSINGIDCSGKTLRASEDLLKQYLPTITPTLIGNTIILGQGLPHKFSANTPSGRKELLESLSNSDVLYYDIKNRIATRQLAVKDQLRKLADDELEAKTTISVINNELIRTKEELNSLVKPNQESIDRLEKDVVEYSNNISLIDEELTSINNKLDIVKSSLELELAEVERKLSLHEAKYNSDIEVERTINSDLKWRINKISSDIQATNNQPDICPTCGQKLLSTHKIDLEAKYEEVRKLQEQLTASDIKLKDILAEKHLISNNIKDSSNIIDLKDKETSLSASTRDLNCRRIAQAEVLSKAQIELSVAKEQLNNYEANRSSLVHRIESKEFTLNSLNEELNLISSKVDEWEERDEAISKIDSLVKRDFRGILLTNVINFIDKIAKEYCSYVFNTNDLNIYLDGNNLNIDFCSKSLENLSGGEQQRVNLILQLAIRRMMCQYSDFSSNIIVLDEIFDNLDVVGCTKILDLITAVLTDVDSIFIISHHSDELNIYYDGELVVYKSEAGVSKVA